MSSSRVVQTILPYLGFEAKAKVVNTFNKEKVLVQIDFKLWISFVIINLC